MAEIGESKTVAKLARGDQWNFGPFTHQDPDGTPIDLTGCTVFASVTWTGGAADMITEIGADDNATGFYWIDQANGQFAFRIKGRSARTATDSDSENVGRIATFRYKMFNSLGALQTEFVKTIEVLDL